MDKSVGQDAGAAAGRGRPASAPTRERLLAAAAELIAELGWGRVTTRAVAERAGLPHGAVSYHFRGKQELLVDSAMHAFAEYLPEDVFASMGSVTDLLALIRAEVGDPDAMDPLPSRLMLESMREAERDPVLRERMGTMLGSYRHLIIELVRAEQQRGDLASTASAEGIGILLAAIGDGLMLHALLDPDLDVAAAIDALRVLLIVEPGRTTRPGKRRS